jgi:hypothetical protein
MIIDRIRRVFQDSVIGVAVGFLCGSGIRGLKRAAWLISDVGVADE